MKKSEKKQNTSGIQSVESFPTSVTDSQAVSCVDVKTPSKVKKSFLFVKFLVDFFFILLLRLQNSRNTLSFKFGLQNRVLRPFCVRFFLPDIFLFLILLLLSRGTSSQKSV